jgi:antitoxin CptB
MANSTHKLHLQRKLLLWRANHRGTREMDVLLGGFARDNIDSMQPSELDELEKLIDVPDPELMSWIVGEAAVREEYRNSVTERLLAYRVRLV